MNVIFTQITELTVTRKEDIINIWRWKQAAQNISSCRIIKALSLLTAMALFCFPYRISVIFGLVLCNRKLSAFVSLFFIFSCQFAEPWGLWQK